MDREWIALLPMKGHNERIPGKNLRPIAGKPLCSWVLETLQMVDEISRIVVNTDSQEIADHCTSHFDVTIHERPEAIRGDFVSMNRVIEHDLSLLDGHDLFLQTHATNPLMTVGTIRLALKSYIEGLDRHDSLFSVTRHQSRFYDSEGAPVNHLPGELIRTQDLPPLYEENSCLYLFSLTSFREAGKRISVRPAMFEIDPFEAVDIDDESDWGIAERLLVQRSAAPDMSGDRR